MLYDNALLCRVYAHLWRATGSDLARRVAAGDRRLHGARTAHRPRAGSPPRWTPTATTATGRHVEGAYYVWTPEQLREVLGEEDAELAAALLRRHRGGHLRGGRLRPPTPAAGRAVRRRAGRLRQAAAARGARASGRAPGGTTRSSPPGTGWPSPRSPRPAPTSTAPTWSRPPPTPPTCWSASTWTGTARLARTSQRRHAPAPTPVCWRTTPMSPRASSRWPRSPARASGWSSPGFLLDTVLRQFTDRGRRAVRHRGRRRAADPPPAGPDRQRRRPPAGPRRPVRCCRTRR